MVSLVYYRLLNQPSLPHCGQALLGAVNAGHIDINLKTNCASYCASSKIITAIVVHEVGHALGFYHTATGMMNGTTLPADACQDATGFSQPERDAAFIAYHRPVGSRDPDIDPDGQSFALSPRMIN